MLHVTTEIGKPGKREREKRHFPKIHNVKSEPVFKARGRRYIPHNYGTEEEWVPHGENIQPQLTEAGPDWSSRLRYIPDPQNPQYPAAEIWPNNWRSMRPYPYGREGDEPIGPKKVWERSVKIYHAYEQRRRRYRHEEASDSELCDTDIDLVTYRQSDREWLLDPDLTKVGLRCLFDGVHKSSATSENEITHTMLYGKGRPGYQIDNRNGIPEASPGDKSYQVPEYSPSFHKAGSTRPHVRYGPARSFRTPDTFIPLVPVTLDCRDTYRLKSAKNQLQQEVDEVKQLEKWKPATPLSQTLPSIGDRSRFLQLCEELVGQAKAGLLKEPKKR